MLYRRVAPLPLPRIMPHREDTAAGPPVDKASDNPDDAGDPQPVVDLQRAFSTRAVLRQHDFSEYTPSETAAAQVMMAELSWDLGRRRRSTAPKYAPRPLLRRQNGGPRPPTSADLRCQRLLWNATPRCCCISSTPLMPPRRQPNPANRTAWPALQADQPCGRCGASPLMRRQYYYRGAPYVPA